MASNMPATPMKMAMPRAHIVQGMAILFGDLFRIFGRTLCRRIAA
jgi:hypothetical protein